MTDIEDLARELFRAADPSGVFEAADYPIQAHFRRQAQQRLTAEMGARAKSPTGNATDSVYRVVK